jgi:ribonuclease P protein subunit POP4
MNKLWLEYITLLLQIRKEDKEKGIDLDEASVQTSLCGKLVKADFSGAKVKIVKSKNVAMEGTEGLIVRESARAFVLISPNDAVKTIPKEGSVFQLTLPAHLTSKNNGKPVAVNVWGDSILYKGSERSKLKFKEKFNLTLY